MVDGDLELLRDWRAGDDGAGNRLVRRHFDSIYRFFENKVREGADEMTQRTFLGCVEAKERRPLALLGWTGFEQLAASDLAIDDEPAARASRRERGLPPLLDLALRRAEEGGGGEMAGVERLLALP